MLKYLCVVTFTPLFCHINKRQTFIFPLFFYCICPCQILNTAMNKTPSPDTPSATLYAFSMRPIVHGGIFLETLFFCQRGRLLSGVRVLGAGRRPLYRPYVGLLLRSQPPGMRVKAARLKERQCCPAAQSFTFSKKARLALVVHLLQSAGGHGGMCSAHAPVSLKAPVCVKYGSVFCFFVFFLLSHPTERQPVHIASVLLRRCCRIGRCDFCMRA